MPADRVFVDTNILVYGHDLDAGEKHSRARARLEELWAQEVRPWTSVQVLQELFVNLVRQGVAPATARRTTENYLAWNVVESTKVLLLRGFDEQARWKLSFWDGLVLAAARQARVDVLWSEDFNTGQDYEGISASNPLL